jgi:hypothetical protein
MSDVFANAETEGTPEEVIGGDVKGDLVGTVIPPEIAVGDEEIPVSTAVTDFVREDPIILDAHLTAWVQKFEIRLRAILTDVPKRDKDALEAAIKKLAADVENGL